MRATPPNEYRIRTHPELGTTDADGMNGAFELPPLIGSRHLYVIVSDGADWHASGLDGPAWEHVSVHALDNGHRLRTPTWEEMAHIKDIFFEPTECVIEFHPPKAQYVNLHPHTLHLWRCPSAPFPLPPSTCV